MVCAPLYAPKSSGCKFRERALPQRRLGPYIGFRLSKGYGLVDLRLEGLRRSIAVPIASVALLALGATAPGAAAAQTKTVPIEAHLSAYTDPSSFMPGCPSNCERTYYSGTGKYTGDLVGDLAFAGYSYRREDGKLASHEDNNLFGAGPVQGTVVGCGSGTFRYTADGVFNDPGPAQGGVLTGEEFVEVIPGSGTGELTGLTGSLYGTFVVPPDGSLQVDYTGTFTCRKKVSPAQRERKRP